MEWKLFDGAVPYVSTFDFHRDRERAPHLEQEGYHRDRLLRAAELVEDAAADHGTPVNVCDLGCGDGGLLSLIQQLPGITAWGYDFQPSNQSGWSARGVSALACDAFGADRDLVRFGDITVATEVLEHLADPHETVRWIGANSRYLIASSPLFETDQNHASEHAWAWDQEGFIALLAQGGFTPLLHEPVWMSQIVLARKDI